MPYIKISGMSKEKVCEIGDNLINIMSEELEIPKERIRVFYDPKLEILNGKIVDDKVLIDIEWMPRPVEVGEKVAKRFFEYFEKFDYKGIKIYFQDINKDYHYTK